MSENNSLRKNTFLLTMGTILNKGLLFLVIPFFSRWLSSSEYGKFDLLYTYISLLIPIITLSTQEAVFRFSVDESDINKKISNITNGFIIDIINFFICILISLLFINTLDKRIYISFILYLFAELFSVYLRGYLRSIKRLDIYSFSMVISTFFMTVLVTIFVRYCKFGIYGILLGYGIGTLIGDLIVCIWSSWFCILDFGFCSIHRMKLLIKYSLPLVPNDISWWIMNASDRQIINFFFSDMANGIYAIAHKIPALCSVVFNMFSVSWQQDIVEKINLSNNDKYINKILEKLLVFLLSVCSGLLAGSFVLYYYIFDLKYFEAIKYTPILILSTIFMAISQFLGGIQIALKRPRQNGMTTVLGAISNIFFHIFLIKIIGLYAACVSTLVANFLISLLRIVLIRDTYRIRITKKIVLSICGCIYFFFMAYIHTYIILNIINLILAIIFFYMMNRKIVYEFICRE